MLKTQLFSNLIQKIIFEGKIDQILYNEIRIKRI